MLGALGKTDQPLGYMEPMAPTLVEAPPAGAEWITEVKWDGYRTQIVKDGQRVRLITRNGQDWSSKYWPISLAAEVLPCEQAIIDGEVVVLDEQHRSSFSELQLALGRRQAGRFVFIAFDLLQLDGIDFRKLPLVVRRERLARLIADGAPQSSSARRYPARRTRFSPLPTRPASRASSANWPKAATVRPLQAMAQGQDFRGGRLRAARRAREQGKPAIALMAKNGRYAGGAFVTLPIGIRERLWERVEGNARPGAEGCQGDRY